MTNIKLENLDTVFFIINIQNYTVKDNLNISNVESTGRSRIYNKCSPSYF